MRCAGCVAFSDVQSHRIAAAAAAVLVNSIEIVQAASQREGCAHAAAAASSVSTACTCAVNFEANGRRACTSKPRRDGAAAARTAACSRRRSGSAAAELVVVVVVVVALSDGGHAMRVCSGCTAALCKCRCSCGLAALAAAGGRPEGVAAGAVPAGEDARRRCGRGRTIVVQQQPLRAAAQGRGGTGRNCSGCGGRSSGSGRTHRLRARARPAVQRRHGASAAAIGT